MIQEDLEIEDVDDESYYLRELSKLKKKLKIATKALKKYAGIETHDWIDSKVVAKRALKEMEGVK